MAKSWDEYDAKHLVSETRHLSAARLQELLREMVQEVGLSGGDESAVTQECGDTSVSVASTA